MSVGVSGRRDDEFIFFVGVLPLVAAEEEQAEIHRLPLLPRLNAQAVPDPADKLQAFGPRMRGERLGPACRRRFLGRPERVPALAVDYHLARVGHEHLRRLEASVEA